MLDQFSDPTLPLQGFCGVQSSAKNTVISPVEILRKGTISPQFRANRSKLCGNRAFPQNFHTRKSSEITVFFLVKGSQFDR